LAFDESPQGGEEAENVASSPPPTGRCEPCRWPPLIVDRTVPRLADGTELLGPYRGSGLWHVPFLIRTPGGHVVQITAMLYTLAAAIDGRRDTAALAVALSEQLGRPVSARNVDYLLTRKLQPLGLLADAAHVVRTPAPPAAPAGFAPFRRRRAVVPHGVVAALARCLQPLFWPPIAILVLGALAAFDVWLVRGHGIGAGIRQLLLEPLVFVSVIALVVASGAFHELGHAAACRYGGAKPGKVGVGLYVAWPVFYSDVTDSYRLGRRGRLRTDLGGVYFNAVFAVVAAAAYLVTGIEALTAFVVFQQLEIAHQFMPFLRLDGYYVIADLAGVPEPFARLRPVLANLARRRDFAPAVDELRPRARAVIAVWGLSAVPLLAINLLFVAFHGPGLLETLGRMLPGVVGTGISALREGHAVAALAAAIRLALLVVPMLGLAVLLARLSVKGVRGVYRLVSARAQRRGTETGAAARPHGAAAEMARDLIEIPAGVRSRLLYAAWPYGGPVQGGTPRAD
jgi:putative peptide zinc metalloprotease protein